MHQPEVAQSKGSRIALMTAGGACVALALVGVVVPGLPTTVFVLAASYCFARSCPAWDRRLHEHRVLGAGLRAFRETGGMTPRAKGLALASMWVGIGVSLLLLRGASPSIAAVVLVAGCGGSAMIVCGIRTVTTGSTRTAGRRG